MTGKIKEPEYILSALIILGAGTIPAILFLIQLHRGSRFESAVAGLDGMEFPLHNLYTAGFGWSSGRLLKRGRELAADEVFPDKLFPAEEILNEEATVSLNSHTSEKGYLVRLSTQEKIPVNKSVFRIGKSRNGMDYYIDNNAAISRNHAIILQKEQHYYIIDTDSRNHIYLNGKMIPANQEIELPGYTNLRLADEEFLFFIEASS